jgi:hypothetical protein
MGNSSLKFSEDHEFITSERWKCEISPSGAHHWIIQAYQMTCRHCHYTKDVNNTSYGLTKIKTK